MHTEAIQLYQIHNAAQMNTLVFPVTFPILQREREKNTRLIFPANVTQSAEQSIVLPVLWNPTLCIIGAAVTFQRATVKGKKKALLHKICCSQADLCEMIFFMTVCP